MSALPNIVILTGAGLSAESGIPTFRDAKGLWEQHDIDDVATPQGYARNPDLVHAFYNQRRRDVLNVKPNAAHYALAKLEREHAGTVTTITQNIDPLHEDAGTQNLIHMHGELLKIFCGGCKVRRAWREDLSTVHGCPDCNLLGRMRPDVVWFGEMPYQMDDIAEAIAAADVFVSIGTSGNVYPAAGFVAGAREAGAHTIELNLAPSDGAHLFHETHQGPATKIVPAFVDRLLGGAV